MGGNNTRAVYNTRIGKYEVHPGQDYNPVNKGNVGDVWGSEDRRHSRSGDKTPKRFSGGVSLVLALLITLFKGGGRN